jgi:hypothetical protein
MRTVLWLNLLGAIAGCTASHAAGMPQNPAEKVKVEIESVGLHPGMNPGMYVCASGHLHIKGTVENLTDAPLGKVKVRGKAFDSEDNLLGTATASTKKATVAPGGREAIDIEFLTVTGAMLEKVKRHEVTVLEAPSQAK